MLVKKLGECKEFLAGDGCLLREVILPPRDLTNENFSIAHARILPGKKTSKHALKSSETYVFLEGQGTAHVGKESARVEKGSVVFVPRNTPQWVENTGKANLVFFVVVSPPWRQEDETVL